MFIVKVYKSVLLRKSIANLFRTCNTTGKFMPRMTLINEYPEARRDENVIDDLHGIKICDPYRWLEDPDSNDTKAFVEAQNKISEKYLTDEKWNLIKEQLTKLWNYPRYSTPARHGSSYFFFQNTGLQNQHVLYKQNSLTDEPIEFLDPNKLSDDGSISLLQTSFSENGQYLAYGLSQGGSYWIRIKIRNVETSTDYPEVLEKVKFSSMAWTKDNKGFFYCRYIIDLKMDGSDTEMNKNQKLYYHRVGEPQEKDVLVVEFPDEPNWLINAEVSDCGKYLIVGTMKDCRDNLLFFANLEENGDIHGKIHLTQIVFKYESDYEYVTNTDSSFIFRTNKNAPNYQLITIDLKNPEEENWKTLIPNHPKDVLTWAYCVNDNKLITGYIRDVKSMLQVHALKDGSLIRTFPLDIGTIVELTGKKQYSEIFFNFQSFLTPGIIYHYDFEKPNEEPKVFREVKLKLDGFNAADYKTEQVFFNSKDGTKVPMFIVQQSKRKIDETRPCLMYGYGGFNVSLQPLFTLNGLMFINLFDGILVYPNIRGGGEYGEAWHNAGRLEHKQNSFDDFQAAAQHLVMNKYTEHKKIVIMGGSNGGLLVGTCINQTPELFGAAIIQVPVCDLLRYHKFTTGNLWMSDYGNPDDEKDFKRLLKISPLHNVKCPTRDEEEYPATLILTGDHDDHVSPLHSLKFTATLHNSVKNCEYQKSPLLLKVLQKAGHGSGKPTTKKIEESTDILTFVYLSLNLNINT